MKVVIYVDVENNLYTEEEFNEILKNKVKILTKDEDEFSDYLSDTYSSLELFRLTEEEQKDVISDFEENWCLQRAKQILCVDENYVEREIEI